MLHPIALVFSINGIGFPSLCAFIAFSRYLVLTFSGNSLLSSFAQMYLHIHFLFSYTKKYACGVFVASLSLATVDAIWGDEIYNYIDN